MLPERVRIMSLFIFGWVIVLATAQPSPSVEPGSTNTSPSLNPKPTGSVPTTTSTGAQFKTTSGGQVPITKVAITEHTLGVEKPTTAPLSTKPDTWTPAGLSGAGKPMKPVTGNVNLPDLPYDPNKSTMTIGEQILKQQQQQQAPVEYDMFGFPIDNTAGSFMHQGILRPTIYDATYMTSLYSHIGRRSRRAVLYHGNIPAEPHGHELHRHPPKPPVIDTVSPGRRRPPPPPPPFDQTIHQTQYKSSPGHAKHVPPHGDKKQQQQQRKPSRGHHKQHAQSVQEHRHTPEQSPQPHHVLDEHQQQTNSLAAEFAEAISGEQFVSNPRNPLQPKRMAPRYRSQLFSEVNAPKVAPRHYSSNPNDQWNPKNAKGGMEALHNSVSPSVQSENSATEMKNQNTNSGQTINDANQNYDNSSPNMPDGNPEQPHNTNHKHGTSKKDLINTEPVLDFDSLIADIKPSQHGHDTLAHTHEQTAGHPHDINSLHLHDSAGSHVHHSTAAHSHESTVNYAHEITGSHMQDSAGAHTHESAGSHTHETNAHNNDTPTPIKTSVPPHVPHANIAPVSGQGQPHTATPTTKQRSNVNRIKLSKNVRTKPTGNRKQRKRPGRRWQRPDKRNGGKRRPAVNKPKPVPSGVHERNPAVELEAHFMTMFDTWYKQKFQASTTSPSVAPVSRGTEKGPTVKLKPVITNRKAINKDVKPKPAAINKTALFNEFMTMFRTQMGETLKARSSSTQQASSVTMTMSKAPPKTTTASKPRSETAAPHQQHDITHHKPERQHGDNALLSADPETANSGVPDLIPTIAPPYVAPEVGTTKAHVVTVRKTRPPTTAAPAIDPDVLADINEARSYQGLPPLKPYQVDSQGNIKPYYRKLLNGGRLPGGNLRSHGLHSHGGMNSGGLLGHTNSIRAQHDAIHREAGHALSPMLHREIHRLLRIKGRNQRRNLFGILPQRNPKPNPIDPDLMADIMEAAQARGAAAFGR